MINLYHLKVKVGQCRCRLKVPCVECPEVSKALSRYEDQRCNSASAADAELRSPLQNVRKFQRLSLVLGTNTVNAADAELMSPVLRIQSCLGFSF